MKKYYLILFIFLTFFIYADNLKVYFVDVGQGDGTLIITPNHKAIIMDCNSGYGYRFLDILHSEGFANTINYMIASHYHADHIGGLDEIINGGIDVINACYDRGGSYSSTAYSDYVSAVNSTTGGRQTAVLGETIDLGNSVTFQILTENGEVFDGGGVYSNPDENGNCVTIHLKYKNFDLYVGGDLTSGVEDLLGPKLGDIDVYQVDHHGSTTSSSENFITDIKPEVSIISCGDGNSYGHPKQEIIDRLVAHNSYIYQTELGNGGTIPSGKGEVAENTILLTTNGCSYDISYGTAPVKTYVCDTSCDDTPPLFAGISNVYDTRRGGELAVDFSDAVDSDNSYPITYNIYMSTFSGGEDLSKSIETSDTHPAFIAKLAVGTTYYFIVRAKDLYGNEDTNTIEIAGIPGPDTLPPDFNGIKTITLTGNPGEIKLSWDNAEDNSLPITYNIYRSTISGNEDFLVPVGSTANLFWTDTGLIDGTTYYYIVRAKDQNGFEDNNTVEKSLSSKGDTIAPAFNGLKEIFTLESRVLLVWDKAVDNTSDTITYSIYRSKVAHGENFTIPTFVTNNTSFYDDSLIEGITYYYIVRATDLSGNCNNNEIERSVSLTDITPKIKIYPNPVKDNILNIKLNFIATLNIYTISGINVYKSDKIISNDEGYIRYNVNYLKSGIYIIVLRSAKSTDIRRIAIIK